MHEYPSMQRHGKSVPVSFYARFSADARNLADEVASGKCVSVLEGGYSDRALTSAAMAHCAGLAGLADGRPASEREWWDVESLIQLEKMAKRKAAASTSTSQTNRRKAPTEPTWLTRASKIFNILENASDPESAGGKDESRSVAGAGLTSGSSGGVGMGTSPTSERVLRDRAAIRARPAYDQTTTPAAQSPPQRRAATATAAGGARRGGAAVGGGAGGAKATEKQKETDEVPTGATEVDMRTTEPTFEPETSELPPPGPPAALVNVETPHAYAHAHLPTSTSTQDETQPAAPPTLSTTATETQIGGQPHIKAEAGADTQDELATHMASLDIRRGAGSESEAVPAFASERALGSTSAIGTGAGHDSTSAQAQASAPSATTTES